MHPVALICTTILGLLLFGLGLAVSVQRFREKRGMGASDDPKNRLNKLVRAHANTAEFAPFLAVLFLFLGSRDPSPLVLGLVATRSMARPNPLRFTGALGTYLTGAALSVLLLAGL